MEDTKLLLYSEWASEIINTYLCRPTNGIDYKTRTQYYDGTGTQRLLLRNRPVYPAPPDPYSSITVWVDQQNGYFGTPTTAFSDSPLVYGQDYTMQIDQDDGSSRSAILIRMNRYWPKPGMRTQGLLSPYLGQDTGSIKVQYTAGWTLDTLPAAFRMAVNILIAELRFFFPTGRWITGESYEERSVSYADRKWLDLVEGLLWPYKNWKW